MSVCRFVGVRKLRERFLGVVSELGCSEWFVGVAYGGFFFSTLAEALIWFWVLSIASVLLCFGFRIFLGSSFFGSSFRAGL